MRASRTPITLAVGLVSLLGGCTLQHSRQALQTGVEIEASPDATFISEEDSGLGILAGLFLLSEPDHYVVLLERMRRRHRCGRIHSAQLDFYTDHWLLITFPIARVTAVCEPIGQGGEAAVTEPAPAPDSVPESDSVTVSDSVSETHTPSDPAADSAPLSDPKPQSVAEPAPRPPSGPATDP